MKCPSCGYDSTANYTAPPLERLQREMKHGYIKFEDKPIYWWEQLKEKRRVTNS